MTRAHFQAPEGVPLPATELKLHEIMKILSSVFFFKWSFIDFGSHIRSVIPFELSFEYGVRSGSKFILVSPPFTDMIILSLLN